ncbi:MAG: hypothetical protein CMG75_03410 [Candidatus Marinimicrobia bacterium]|nr:hypothetical protein [Candidatus Neomarinimicrobiota bacterium]|tara:strand:- start:19419 stop:19985 length:567 start_codon:yes stop_codon:yes gene_type:complete
MANLTKVQKIAEYHAHEYAEIQIYQNEQLTDLLNYRVQSIEGDNILLLNQFIARGFPRVLLISFFSEWCPNCQHEALVIDRINEKFVKEDFEVIVIVEYSDSKKWEDFITNKLDSQLTYFFGEMLEKNEKKRFLTNHHMIKTLVNDKRKWGVPLHFMIIGGRLNKVCCVKGEFEKLELETFLIKKLNI